MYKLYIIRSDIVYNNNLSIMDLLRFQANVEREEYIHLYSMEKNFLFDVLSDKLKFEFLEKYQGIYLTGDKHIDEQIIGTVLILKQGIKNSGYKIKLNKENIGKKKLKKLLSITTLNKEKVSKKKIKKLLFILNNTIGKIEFLWIGSKMNIARSCRNRIKTILLSAVDKYQNDELNMLYSFSGVTFDVLENLNSFNSNQWNQVKQIMNLLKNDLGIYIFPASITTENLGNIINNILYLKNNNFDNMELFTNNMFNKTFLTNGEKSIVDTLALPFEDFKLVLLSIGKDLNILSFRFIGYEAYKNIFSELRKRNFTNDEILKILLAFKYKKSIKQFPFRIDRCFSVEKLLSSDINSSINYEQCEYIYNNISQNPNQLLRLFEFNYETLLYIYHNITHNVDEIINDYNYIKNVSGDDLRAIFENIKNYKIANAVETFRKLMKTFGDKKYNGKCIENIIFCCKYFTNDILDRFFNNNLENSNWLNFVAKSESENLEFFYENKIFISLNDFIDLNNNFLLYMNIESLKFLYNKGLCTTKNDFALAGATIYGYSFRTVKFLFDQGIYTTLDDLISEKNSKLLKLDTHSMKILHSNNLCTSIDDFFKYEHIIKSADKESLSILCDLYHKNLDYDVKFNFFNSIFQEEYSNIIKNEIVHKVRNLPIESANKYLKLCKMLYNSGIPDIQIIKDYLIIIILDTDDPENVIHKINTIFIESNLPIISKIFQIFKYVYTENSFGKKLEDHKNISPYLQSCGTYEKRLSTIYKDLMHIMIKSGESSLKEFIQSIISCKKSLFDFENGETLDYDGYKQVLSLLKKALSLSIINSNLVNDIELGDYDGNINVESIKNFYKKLRSSFLIKSSDSLYTFFLNLSKKLGYYSLEDILSDMDKSQKKANERGLSMFNSINHIFDYSENYFLKSIELEPLGEILNRGVTSKEYLGGGEGSNNSVSSDQTPFDTDGIMVKGKDIFQEVKGVGYGNLAIVINTNRSGIYNTDNGLQGYEPETYELFKNNDNDKFYGIRTGIDSTEFDAIIYKNPEIKLEEIQQIRYLVAKNGFYLPILDLDGNILFTPDEYHILRQGFSFSDKYQGYDIEKKDGDYVLSRQYDKINQGDETFNRFIQGQRNWLTSSKGISNEAVAGLVFDKIKDILESELGIQCNQNKNSLGAELYDSGSTGRGTEIPSCDIDLDFTLLLNSDDYRNLETIQSIINKKIGTVESSDHSTMDGNGFQIKSIVNDLGKIYGYEKGIRFDLLILEKTKSYLYPSNIAMQDRLTKVEQMFGKDVLNFVRGNIIIMKKLLKSQGTYKNSEGGMGGIGVENWIMQHHGNFVEALESFEEVAYRGRYINGKMNISFEEFKNIYSIWDCGQNFKDNNNDNYILKMNESGYNGILNIIKIYRNEGLLGIYKLICDYENTKAEFIN